MFSSIIPSFLLLVQKKRSKEKDTLFVGDFAATHQNQSQGPKLPPRLRQFLTALVSFTENKDNLSIEIPYIN